MPKGPKLYEEAKRLIPGGSNLYSKRGELHAPGEWPQYYKSARGCEITDLDGRTYLDFSGAGVGACILGYRDEDVDQAVIKAIATGSTSALLGEEEVELARLLTILHPWAQMCRFTRSGGEAMAVAIRIAQAKTGRQAIVYKTNSYHGWHVNNPVTGERYAPDGMEPAAYIIEPERLTPEPQLAQWRDLAAEQGAVLIFDEISAGFRSNLGGSHLKYEITPDIAVFSKAMANGYPMGAVVGTEAVMSAAMDTFISSTAWSERIGPTAAVATIQKLWATEPWDRIQNTGYLVRNTIEYHSRRNGLNIKVHGPNHMLHVEFESAEQQTAYTRLMLERGILAGKDFYPSAAHKIEHIERFADAVRDVLPRLSSTQTEAAESGIKRI